MIITTGNEVSGKEIVKYLGIVRGLTVRAPRIGQGLAGGFQSIFGGHNDAYTAVCETARQHAYDLLVAHAKEMGADAVIGMRYDATEFAQGITEVLAYGTAVKLS